LASKYQSGSHVIKLRHIAEKGDMQAIVAMGKAKTS